MLKTLTEIKMGKEHCQYDAHKSAGFPFAVYYSDIKKYLGQYIPAHWHREFEISLVIRGKVRFFIDNTELLLSEGEGVFINSNVFHGMNRFGDSSEFVTAVFDSSFICGGEDESPFMQKYIKPFASDKTFSFIRLQSEVLWQSDCLDLLHGVYSAAREEDFAFEFAIREDLSKIVINILKNLGEKSSALPSSGESSVFEMCEFIKENYGENISVKEIAAAASVSERECYRRFKSAMFTSPIKYLDSLRIKKAAELLSATQASVTDICFSVGFSNGSYFSHRFKEMLGCSPLEYRKANFHL